MPAILFVCYANICRSPAAGAILHHLAQKRHIQDLHIESCAISDDRLHSPPDDRIVEALKKRKIACAGKAQLFKLAFFEKFDHILPVDQMTLNTLRYRARTPEEKAKIVLLTDFSKKHPGQNIPDPYGKNPNAFEEVCDLLEECCENLLDFLYPIRDKDFGS